MWQRGCCARPGVNLLERDATSGETSRVHWKKVTMIGMGLLGGSLGLALKRRGLGDRVVGYVRRSQSIRECEEAGAVDRATLDLAEAVTDADLVVFCTPLAQMAPLGRQLGSCLKRGAVVTDVGSVKTTVVRDLERLIRRAGGHFVGSHPMAGSERNGVRSAVPHLFVDATCVVTPTVRSNHDAVHAVERMWRSVGGKPLRMSPKLHDQLVSRSSHLPHIVAAELANFVLSPSHPKEQAILCATGFRDTTRIACSSVEMWRDIVLANRTFLGRALDRFITDLEKLRQALRTENEAAISTFLRSARQRRQSWSQRGAFSSE